MYNDLLTFECKKEFKYITNTYLLCPTLEQRFLLECV
jgi:hypothetical protein